MGKLVEIQNGLLNYNGVCLKDLALKYGTPLKVTFLDVIRSRVTGLKSSFDKAIDKLAYQGKFIYLNANKANYSQKEIETAFLVSDGLETSSYYDLLLTYDIFKDNNESNKIIVCNGYKSKEYLDTIIKISKEIKIIDVIDSVEEYNYLKDINANIEIGLRIHMTSLYEDHDDRFGITKDEFDYILNDVKNTNLSLTTIHFHQRGFEYIEEKFKENIKKIFMFYKDAVKIVPTVKHLDIGGGTPLPNGIEFDYDSYALMLIKLLKELSLEYKVAEPDIISENGKYSMKDSTINIYKVLQVKNTSKGAPWYFVDGSLLIAMPEFYALGEEIDCVPISNLDKKAIKARLGGITCDCDDVFPVHGDMNLPEDIKDLYIALLGTGSYQNSMNGRHGIHHCLLPEEIDVVIDGKKEYIRHQLQSMSEIKRLMN